MSRTSNWGAYWFRKNGRKWDRKFFNEQLWYGGGGVNRWDIFKHNRETKSAWVGTALQRGQLVTWQTITFIYNFSFWKSSSLMTFFLQVIWWIWILAPHHVWAPHSLLHHFLCRPPCSRKKLQIDNIHVKSKLTPSYCSFDQLFADFRWWSWCECGSKDLTMILRGKPTPGWVMWL